MSRCITKSLVHLSKTQISLGIRPVWSVCWALNRTQGFFMQTGEWPGWSEFAGRTGLFVVMQQLIYILTLCAYIGNGEELLFCNNTLGRSSWCYVAQLGHHFDFLKTSTGRYLVCWRNLMPFWYISNPWQADFVKKMHSSTVVQHYNDHLYNGNFDFRRNFFGNGSFLMKIYYVITEFTLSDTDGDSCWRNAFLFTHFFH